MRWVALLLPPSVLAYADPCDPISIQRHLLPKVSGLDRQEFVRWCGYDGAWYDNKREACRSSPTRRALRPLAFLTDCTTRWWKGTENRCDELDEAVLAQNELRYCRVAEALAEVGRAAIEERVARGNFPELCTRHEMLQQLGGFVSSSETPATFADVSLDGCNASWWETDDRCVELAEVVGSGKRSLLCAMRTLRGGDDALRALLRDCTKRSTSCDRLRYDCAALHDWEACDDGVVKAPYEATMRECEAAVRTQTKQCHFLHVLVDEDQCVELPWDCVLSFGDQRGHLECLWGRCEILPVTVPGPLESQRTYNISTWKEVEREGAFDDEAGRRSHRLTQPSDPPCGVGVEAAFDVAVDALLHWREAPFLPYAVAYWRYKRAALAQLSNEPATDWVACANATLRADRTSHRCDALRPLTCVSEYESAVAHEPNGTRVVFARGVIGNATYSVVETWPRVAQVVGLPPRCTVTTMEAGAPCVTLVAPRRSIRNETVIVVEGMWERRDYWDGDVVVREEWTSLFPSWSSQTHPLNDAILYVAEVRVNATHTRLGSVDANGWVIDPLHRTVTRDGVVVASVAPRCRCPSALLAPCIDGRCWNPRGIRGKRHYSEADARESVGLVTKGGVHSGRPMRLGVDAPCGADAAVLTLRGVRWERAAEGGQWQRDGVLVVDEPRYMRCEAPLVCVQERCRWRSGRDAFDPRRPRLDRVLADGCVDGDCAWDDPPTRWTTTPHLRPLDVLRSQRCGGDALCLYRVWRPDGVDCRPSVGGRAHVACCGTADDGDTLCAARHARGACFGRNASWDWANATCAAEGLELCDAASLESCSRACSEAVDCDADAEGLWTNERCGLDDVCAPDAADCDRPLGVATPPGLGDDLSVVLRQNVDNLGVVCESGGGCEVRLCERAPDDSCRPRATMPRFRPTTPRRDGDVRGVAYDLHVDEPQFPLSPDDPELTAYLGMGMPELRWEGTVVGAPRAAKAQRASNGAMMLLFRDFWGVDAMLRQSPTYALFAQQEEFVGALRYDGDYGELPALTPDVRLVLCAASRVDAACRSVPNRSWAWRFSDRNDTHLRLRRRPEGGFVYERVWLLRVFDALWWGGRATASTYETTVPRSTTSRCATSSLASGGTTRLGGGGSTATNAPPSRFPDGAATGTRRLATGALLPPSVVVFVVDSGVRATHAALRGRVVDGYGEAGDRNGHGTHVAGIVAKHAPTATIVPVRVVSSAGTVDNHATRDGLRWIRRFVEERKRANGATAGFVVNLSLCWRARFDVQEEVDALHALGVVVVVAACNWGDHAAQHSFTDHDDVVSVGSIDRERRLADYSCYGLEVTVQANGESVRSASNLDDDALATRSGTSMAAARVSGVVAQTLVEGGAWEDRLQASTVVVEPSHFEHAWAVGKVQQRVLEVRPSTTATVDCNRSMGYR